MLLSKVELLWILKSSMFASVYHGDISFISLRTVVVYFIFLVSFDLLCVGLGLPGQKQEGSDSRLIMKMSTSWHKSPGFELFEYLCLDAFTDSEDFAVFTSALFTNYCLFFYQFLDLRGFLLMLGHYFLYFYKPLAYTFCLHFLFTIFHWCLLIFTFFALIAFILIQGR